VSHDAARSTSYVCSRRPFAAATAGGGRYNGDMETPMDRTAAFDSIESLTATAKTINAALHDLRGTFGHLQERIAPYLTADKARDVARQGRDYAKQHPATVTVVAAGIGLLVGWYLYQRSGDSVKAGTDYSG